MLIVSDQSLVVVILIVDLDFSFLTGGRDDLRHGLWAIDKLITAASPVN